MTEETQILTAKPKKDYSHIFHVSIRAWGLIIVLLTVCAMSFVGKKIEEPLYTLVGMIVGFYYGQNQKPLAKPTA